MSDHSVRLRFVGWLHGFLDQISELGMKKLSEGKIEPQTGAHMCFGPISVVNDGLGEGQVNNAAPMPPLNEQSGQHWGNTIVFDDPVYVAYAQRLAASNHNFISHQKSPMGIVFDVSSFNQKMDGVQS
jgi:hypothetical protein